MAYGGSATELYSEVLAQVCLAYAMKNGRAMTPLNLNKDTIDDVKSLIETHSAANMNDDDFLDDLIGFGLYPISRGFTWVDGQGAAMLEVKNKFSLSSSGYKIYNDKLYGKTFALDNPYVAFLKANTGAKPDKWNPADMWVMNADGRKALSDMNKRVKARTKVSLGYANQTLKDQFTEKNIIPISLKKPSRSPHLEIVNSNEYVTRLSLNQTNNPTIEYTMGNKDVKINFTIETIRLEGGQKASTARRNPQNIKGTVVNGSQKHIRLKYHVDNKKVELEYDQSGRSVTRTAEAKMGNLGAKNFQAIINGTSKQGVRKLNQIQDEFDGEFGEGNDLTKDPWFNGNQFGVVKARHSAMELEPHYLKLAEYVRKIWEAIDGSAPEFERDTKGQLDQAYGLWSKARAGELGVAVGSITNETIKRRVIQNLYEAAASISYATGLNKEELELETLAEPTARRVSFNAGVYVKVY